MEHPVGFPAGSSHENSAFGSTLLLSDCYPTDPAHLPLEWVTTYPTPNPQTQVM